MPAMRLSRRITLGTSVIIILLNILMMNVIAWRYQRGVREALTESARSYYHLILTVRAWVAETGGVYVPEGPGRDANPFLPVPAIETLDGRRLVWRNPAMVTREISELGHATGRQVEFHLASLEPINPVNAADDFERAALLMLNGQGGGPEGPREFTRFERIRGTKHFRYFAPLYMESACAGCHAAEEYQPGAVRGGISILLPTDRLTLATLDSVLVTLLGSLAISLLILMLMQRAVVRPLRRLEDAAREIGRGNYDTPILTHPGDEIGDVGRAMARMQQAIRRRIGKQVQAEKMMALGELSAGIAHEIRNPLFALRNDLDYLQRNYTGGADQEEVYGSMESGLRRLGTIVDAVLRYARPHRPEYGMHTAQELLDRCLALLGKQLSNRQVQLSVELAPDLPAFEMDIHKMEQVFVNLLTNALKAMAGGGGHVRITGRLQGEHVVLEVADDGRGIDAEDLPRIFDPFFTRSSSGTGLGLTIVKRFLDQHHGTIDVTSEPGRGTTFTLHLPVRQSLQDT
jgi:signal transduction histidine kinase